MAAGTRAALLVVGLLALGTGCPERDAPRPAAAPSEAAETLPDGGRKLTVEPAAKGAATELEPTESLQREAPVSDEVERADQ
jgi:hypothetical protein